MIQIFASTNPDKLKSPTLAASPTIMGNLQGCRIPSLLLAQPVKADDQPVLIAISDIGNDSADWGKVEIGMRRSFDSGKTWTTPVETILSLPAHHAPQDFHDWHSAFYIDAVTTQATNGDIVMLVDMYPESKGLHAPEYLESGTGYTSIDGNSYQVLHSEHGNSVNTYTIREEGWIYDCNGHKTRYYIPQHHNPKYQYVTMGDMYYAATPEQGEYISFYPPLVPEAPSLSTDASHDIYVGNIYLNFEKPATNLEHPVFVQKRHVAPPASLYETYETDPAPLCAVVTSYLWVTRSIDQGATWSQPYDITPQVKVASDHAFLGTGPGTGLTLQHQKEASKNGRLLMPVYALGKASALYSDDHGYTWHRANTNGNLYMNNVDECQLIELLNGDVISFGRQSTKAPTPISVSHDGGETWGVQMTTDLISLCCQKSVITYPVGKFPYPDGMEEGKQYVLSSHPSGNAPEDASRTNGVISLGEVQEDGTIVWIKERSLNLTPNPYADATGFERFFAYSSLAVLENGDIGLLYEPQPNNLIAYRSFSLRWIFE
ncbi:MAG: sialidase family protein [Niameybacter sp.]